MVQFYILVVCSPSGLAVREKSLQPDVYMEAISKPYNTLNCKIVALRLYESAQLSEFCFHGWIICQCVILKQRIYCTGALLHSHVPRHELQTSEEMEMVS